MYTVYNLVNHPIHCPPHIHHRCVIYKKKRKQKQIPQTKTTMFAKSKIKTISSEVHFIFSIFSFYRPEQSNDK